MNDKRRLAVLGLYRSGSTATAGVLHRLGVDMGGPFYRDYYEPLLLSRKLRLWWREPALEEMMPREARVQRLSDWINTQESRGSPWVGAKHPLLSARGEDLLEAWGPKVKFIWTHRPVEQSIDSTLQLRWWTAAQCESIQMRLYEGLQHFFSTQTHLRVEFADMIADPVREIARIIKFLEITPDPRDVESAVNSVQYKRGLA